MADEVKDQTSEPKPAWAEKYDSADKMYETLQGYERDLGSYRDIVGANSTLDQVRQGWEWAKGVYQDLNNGKLKYVTADESAKPTTPAAPAQSDDFPAEFDGWTPREQAKFITQRQQDFNKSELARLVKEERDRVAADLNDYKTRTDAEKQLLFQVLEAGRNNPNLDLKAALAKAAELKAMAPEQLLQFSISNMVDPAKQEALMNERVNKLVAEKLQEEETKRIEGSLGTGNSQRRITLKKPGSQMSREDRNRSLVKEFHKAGLY